MSGKLKWFAAGAFTHWLFSDNKSKQTTEEIQELEKAKEEQRKYINEHPGEAAIIYLIVGFFCLVLFILFICKLKKWGFF